MEKVPAKVAGYMELPGATKDAGCRRVDVTGGVSQDLGCCNLFEFDKRKAKKFSCGTCEYLQLRTLGGRIGG